MSDQVGGRVLAVHVSPGGVPKHPVASARVGRYGLEGDRQEHATSHGGPTRAVCLLGIEAIRRVAAEGNPISPGSVGENLTTEGIELGALPAGSRLAIGEELVLELTRPASPCTLIAASFRDGRSARISVKTHPADTRLYAGVLRPGTVRPGDPIVVLPPDPVRTRAIEWLPRLDAVHRKATLATWSAAAAAGSDLRIVDDRELALVAEPGRAGGPWNGGLGFTGLPNLVGRGIAHLRRHGSDGWLELDPDEPEAPRTTPLATRVVLAATPEALAPGSAHGVTVRAIGADEGAAWGAVLAGGSVDRAGGDGIDWRALGPGLTGAAGTTLLLAERDAEPAGAALLQVHQQTGWLSDSAVLPEARGHGVHRALIGDRIRLAIAAGCDLIGADAGPGTRAEAILRSAGFVELGRRARWRADEVEAAGRGATPTRG